MSFTSSSTAICMLDLVSHQRELSEHSPYDIDLHRYLVLILAPLVDAMFQINWPNFTLENVHDFHFCLRYSYLTNFVRSVQNSSYFMLHCATDMNHQSHNLKD